MNEPQHEPSTKPYLIRAIHEWCHDAGYTPYLAVAVDATTRVPADHVKNGEIVLNISALATSHLVIGNDVIEFQARFGGTARAISVPIRNISAIYARENGQGMAFDVPKPAEHPAKAPSAPRPHEHSKPARQSLALVDPPDNGKPGGGRKGNPKLTIVK